MYQRREFRGAKVQLFDLFEAYPLVPVLPLWRLGGIWHGRKGKWIISPCFPHPIIRLLLFPNLELQRIGSFFCYTTPNAPIKFVQLPHPQTRVAFLTTFILA